MKSKLFTLTLLVLLLTVMTTVVHASSLYVGGTDAADDGNCQSTPCATINYAISQAVNGDMIILQDNITEGMVVVNKEITLNGGGFTLNSTSATYGISIQSPNVTIQNIIVNNAGTFGMHQSPGNSHLWVVSTTVSNGGGTGFALNCSANTVLENITATGNSGNGVSITNSQNVMINGITTSGNAFSGSFSAGIGIFSNSTTCTPEGTDGITLQGTVTIAEPVAVYEEVTTGTITNVTLPTTFTHYLGLAGSKFYFTALQDALDAADATLGLDPAYQPLVYVKEVAGTNLYVAPAVLATVDMSIQAAVDAADDDDTINVAVGTYAESISVYKDGLTLLGPNAGIDPNGNDPRSPEAVIQPTSSYGFYVTAQDVTLDGFNIDGQGTALYGIYAYTNTGKGGLLLANNIVKNITTYGFIGYVQSGAPSSNNLVSKNLFESIPGRSIVALWNYYANVMDNVVLDTAVGIYAENANQPEASGTVEWKGNEISATRSGIWYNLAYGTATPLTISDNIIAVEDNPVGTRWDGIWLTSLGGSINPTISGNVITGASVTQLTIGYHMWHNTTTAADGIVVQGGAVTDVDYGVWINNWDGFPTVGGSNAGRSTAKLDQVIIDGAALAGVYLKDNSLNTSGASAYVFANIQDIDITNSAIGILVDGEDASVQVAESRLYDNTQNMVNNNATVTMDATPNWWGTPCDPGNTIVGLVDYSPWWGDPAGNSLVDEDVLIDLGNVIPDGATSQQGNLVLACAPPYSTVEFEEGGVFEGGLIVTTPGLTIKLNGATVGPGSPAFTIEAPNVTITQGDVPGGVLDGNGDTSPAVLVNAGGDNFTLEDVEVREWANGVEVAASVTSFKLFDNWIHSNTGAGLKINSDVTLGGVVSIQGNLFKANGGNGIQHDGNGTLPATYNSWGDVGGPAGPSGDGVSANVTVDPWTFAEVYMDVEPDTEAILRAVNEGDTFDVALKIEAANLYGASFVFSYDDALLTYNGITFSSPWAGTCLQLAGLAANEIGYQCALIDPAPEWDGSTVATFSFEADLPNVLPNDDGPWEALFDISHEVVDTSAGALGGAKVFINNAGFNDPSDPDRNITDTNDGQINITGLANFTGFVDLQGRANDSDAVVEVFDIAGKATSTLLAQGTSANSGAFTTAYAVGEQLYVGGTYYFQINRPLFLPTTIMATAGPMPPIPADWEDSKVMLVRPFTSLSTVVLLGGDATNSNSINIGDASCIGGQYGLAPAVCGDDGTGDVTGDGVVNILDLTLMGGNYEKNSSPWAP